MKNAAARCEAEAAAADLAAQLEMNNISKRALQGVYLRTRRSYNINAMQNAAARHDRLSELPDNILLDILERAGTLDALRTCTLSKRLMRLPAMFARFDIDIRSLTQHHDKASHGFTTADIIRYNNTLADVTEKILPARSPEIHTIHKLRVFLGIFRAGPGFGLARKKPGRKTSARARPDRISPFSGPSPARGPKSRPACPARLNVKPRFPLARARPGPRILGRAGYPMPRSS